ncbi:MAG: hypothetical protein FD167_3678 [bacterium]|nr:MAG: hypothetical protein FD167_3678 [bacterium]
MPLYVLDTDHLSLLQRGNETIGTHLITVSPREIAITVVSLEEQLRGWLAVINKATTSEQRIKAYYRLKEITQGFSELNILDYNQQADKLFEQFRKEKIRIGTQDLRIACIVLAHNGVLLTRNLRDFSQVLGLQTQDWSV